MAKGQDLSRHQRGIVNRYYEHRDGIMTQKLGELVSDLCLAEGKKADTLWGRAATALANTAADPAKVAKILETRNIEALAKLVGDLSAVGKPKSSPKKPTDPPPPAPGAASPHPAGAPSADTLKAALKAFKKRIKLKRLDDESRLGHGPMSSGKKSDVMAIIPPNQYQRSVWEELVKQGKLRSMGGGFYELVDPN